MTDTFKTLINVKTKEYVIIAYWTELSRFTSNVPRLFPLTMELEDYKKHFIIEGASKELVEDIFKDVALVPVSITTYAPL